MVMVIRSIITSIIIFTVFILITMQLGMTGRVVIMLIAVVADKGPSNHCQILFVLIGLSPW